ncbi:MAG: nodulation protein NfeD [Oligoflexales bacterium]|nr:nodulation protein NfeD [Oligoflexales bacterium]
MCTYFLKLKMAKLQFGLSLLLALLSFSGFARERTKLPIRKILSTTVDSSINPATLNYLSTSFEHAQKLGYDLILINLNTPGGLVSTTKEILALIGNSKIPTAIWIHPEGGSATSAGAIIASSAHILAMSPGTNIGAATPVQLGKDLEDKDLRNKAINDLVSLVQSLSQSRGRNQEAFGNMIKEAASYQSQNAVELKLVDFIANTQNEFVEKLQGREISIQGETFTLECLNPQVDEQAMDLGQKLLNILASPDLTYILFMLGAALIYFEFQTPGGFIAGGVGSILLILSGIGFQVLPLNFGSLALIILAFILFILELYITSYGGLSLVAVLSLSVGSLFLFRTDNAYLDISLPLIFATISCITLAALSLTFLVFRDLKKDSNKKNYYSLAGKTATILATLPELGSSSEPGIHCFQVKVAGEIWTAKSQTALQIGETCTVTDEDRINMFLWL